MSEIESCTLESVGKGRKRVAGKMKTRMPYAKKGSKFEFAKKSGKGKRFSTKKG
jgi:hypothetical protein